MTDTELEDFLWADDRRLLDEYTACWSAFAQGRLDRFGRIEAARMAILHRIAWLRRTIKEKTLEEPISALTGTE
jgi:hypothetical protein